MDTIDLKQIFHRGKECVGLYFDNNPALNNLVQQLTGVKWSQTNKCWYIPREPGRYNELKVLTKGKVTLTGSGLEDDKESGSIYTATAIKSIQHLYYTHLSHRVPAIIKTVEKQTCK